MSPASRKEVPSLLKLGLYRPTEAENPKPYTALKPKVGMETGKVGIGYCRNLIKKPWAYNPKIVGF